MSNASQNATLDQNARFAAIFGFCPVADGQTPAEIARTLAEYDAAKAEHDAYQARQDAEDAAFRAAMA